MIKKNIAYIIDAAFWLCGCFIYSAAVTLFISPNQISPGGLTGIATVLNFSFGLPTGITLFVMNIPIIILGFINFGGLFILKTAIATTLLSVALDVSDAVLVPVETDRILASVFGGIFMGVGLSLVLLRGATTGGIDIVAKLVNRRFRHLTIGRLMLIMDGAVILLAAAVYRNIESALYSVIAIYASSAVTDKILYGGDKGKIIYVVSEKSDLILKKIYTVLSRGVTVIDVEGGYTGKKNKMLMCTVRRHEVSAVCNIVYELDKSAFTTIAEAGDVIGEGFKNLGS